MPAEYTHIRYTVDDGIATVILDRPDQLNAFTDNMEAELIAAFDQVDLDDDIRALVLTGSGRAFCAGMDLSDGSQAFDVWSDSDTHKGLPRRPEGELRRDGGGRVALRMFELRKPVIAAINGPAVGVGITMTLAADIRLSVPDAKIGFVFSRRGLVPESCSSWFLPRLVGLPRALQWIYSGSIFRSEEGLDAGLIQEIVSPDRLIGRAREIARDMTEHSAPVSIALSRQLLWRMSAAPDPMVAHRVETLAINVRGVSPDAREGIAAFLDKRPAQFPQRVSTDVPDVFDSYPPPTYRQDHER